ncbi:hypothetical protein OBBRIDRAFT_449377 [Obba rivulosa]|uniref:Uncharacterized protein n=1 Tax=Obba rivulosa TaxID=1052685 RepID=A0A8E2DUQ0_9APHY|nr:hypothetical protein OBBRIDRAFT_449377 [Obba rivulosa]
MQHGCWGMLETCGSNAEIKLCASVWWQGAREKVGNDRALDVARQPTKIGVTACQAFGKLRCDVPVEGYCGVMVDTESGRNSFHAMLSHRESAGATWNASESGRRTGEQRRNVRACASAGAPWAGRQLMLSTSRPTADGLANRSIARRGAGRWPSVCARAQQHPRCMR